MLEENKKKASVGLIILSVLIPICGFILYFVKKKETLNPSAYLWAGIGGMAIDAILRKALLGA